MSHSWKSYLLGCCGDGKRSEKKRRSATTNKLAAPPDDLPFTLAAGSNVCAFSFAELKAATQNFSNRNFIGSGGFGPVYKGFVDGKLRPELQEQEVAVKYLDKEGFQGHREWLVRNCYIIYLVVPNFYKIFNLVPTIVIILN